MTRSLLLCCVLLSAAQLCCVPAVAAAEPPPANTWSRRITVPAADNPLDGQPAQDNTLTAITLDEHAYASSLPELEDLRIVADDGSHVPYLLRRQTLSESRPMSRTWAAKAVQLQPIPGGGLELTWQLEDDDPPVTALTIDTPLQNFEQRVEVWASAGDAEPADGEPLVRDALIFDYSQYMDVRRLTIPVPAGNARSFRMVIGSPTADQQSQLLQYTRTLQGDSPAREHEELIIERRPFRIDRVLLISEARKDVRISDRLVEWPVTVAAPAVDPESRDTVLDITAERQPLAEFQLVTSSDNFSRFAKVELLDDASSSPPALGTATLQQFAFEVDDENLSVPFPARRGTRYRLRITNNDSPPLQITQVRGFGSVDELIFLPPAGQQCTLQYGASESVSPQYDLAAIRRLLEDERAVPVTASLGPPAELQISRGSTINLRSLINNPWILGSVVLVLVGLLGRALYHAGQQIDG